MNVKASPVFGNREMREAANLAIDRQAIMDSIYGGFAEPANGQLTAAFVPGYNTSLEDFPYDPEKAKSLLASTGIPPEVSFSGPTGRWLKDREVSEAIVTMLSDAGFKVKAQFPVFSTWLDQLYAAKTNPKESPDLMFIGHGNELLDPEQTFGTYVSCKGEASGFCDPKIQALGVAAQTELDVPKREAMYQEMWQTLKEDAAYATIANVEQIHFVADGVDWKPRADAFIIVSEIKLA